MHILLCGVDGMTILNWIANKWAWKMWTEYRLQLLSVYNRGEQI